MTNDYTPRPGSYPAKAIEVLLPLAGKMLASGALAQLIGANVKHMGTVLRVAIEHRAIAVYRTQSGNWYGIGDLYGARPVSPDAIAQAENLMRELPASSVFDLGAPQRVQPVAGRHLRIKTIEAGRARIHLSSDGAIRIDRGELSVSLTPTESRELAALVKGKTFEDVAA